MLTSRTVRSHRPASPQDSAEAAAATAGQWPAWCKDPVVIDGKEALEVEAASNTDALLGSNDFLD